MKKELHTLYIKHDGQFKTLSKIALSQLILKIVYLKGNGTSIQQIRAELTTVLSSPISNDDVDEAIRVLIRARKLKIKAAKYFIHQEYNDQLTSEIDENKNLTSKVLDKYFDKAESAKANIEDWFTDTIICFFEKYSFEWFHQITYQGRNGSNSVPNIHEILNQVLINNKNILEVDKEWLKIQFISFINSDESEDNLLFWYYGISMFSSRLITARNYADGISIDMFKNSKFILDTNILMILDLEEHHLFSSLKSMEDILIQLEIKPVYLYTTRDEYLRAMDWRRTEVSNVFDNYDLKVLKSSDCPFIQTALKRDCVTGEDVGRMFERLMDLPVKFIDKLPLEICDFKELNEAVEAGRDNEELKSKINETYKKRTAKDKREKPLSHDASLISGANFLRKTENCWIITSDGTMKRYAIENCIRDENEISIGLDVVIGLMAVNGGGVSVDASNFAPLFKNLIKYSLVPESKAFEVKDLAFILRTNIKVNELSDVRVIEVAREVKRLRVIGEDEENVALYLRRFLEGDTVDLVKSIEEAKSKESIAKMRKEEAEDERDVAYNEIRITKTNDYRDKYDSELRINRFFVLAIPLIVGLLIWVSIKYIIPNQSAAYQFAGGIIIEIIFGILPLIPLNKRFIRKHSEYVSGINQQVESEISVLKSKPKNFESNSRPILKHMN